MRIAPPYPEEAHAMEAHAAAQPELERVSLQQSAAASSASHVPDLHVSMSSASARVILLSAPQLGALLAFTGGRGVFVASLHEVIIIKPIRLPLIATSL